MKNLYITVILFAGITMASQAQSKQTPRELEFSSDDNAKGKRKLNRTESADEKKLVPSKSRKELKGDKLFFIYDYAEAVKSYTGSESLTTKGRRNVAKSYYYMHDNARSGEAYSSLLKYPVEAIPEDYYNYAMVLRSDSKYEESAKWMDKFAMLKPDELRTKSYTENKAGLSALLTDREKYKITHLDLNTDAQDFAPAFYKDRIVFASSRTTKLFPKTSYRTGKPYLNIYVADLKQEQLQAPKTFDESLNGSLNEGTASFTKDGTLMAFTQNIYNLTKKELVVNMEIYFRTFARGKWSEPLPFPVNNKGYSVGHPSLSKDGQTMYFTSDMPGGFGGADIYKVTKTGNEWSQAKNLGSSINTEGNDVFPFYEDNKNILYFSSDGHYGLGGLDLFSSVVHDTVFDKVVNLGSPLNTADDDFSLIVDSLGTTGYFASNRIGGTGDDDIYRVDFLSPKRIEGIAKDIENHPLANTFISLLDENNAIIDSLTTAVNGAYTFTVETKKNYTITGEKTLYTNGTNTANTFGPELIVKADVILLMPQKAEEVVIVEKIIAEKPVAKAGYLRPIYFDLNRYNIRPDARIELDRVVKEMNENPNMRMNLKSYTDCRASRAYNQALSDHRANASANYVRKRIMNPLRVDAKGYGETKLINNCACEGNVVSDCSEEAHQANRRTEFSILITN